MDWPTFILHTPLMTFILGLAAGLIIGSWFTENGNARSDD